MTLEEAIKRVRNEFTLEMNNADDSQMMQDIHLILDEVERLRGENAELVADCKRLNEQRIRACDDNVYLSRKRLDAAEARAKRLEDALRTVTDHLECGPPEADRAHYCPNCDNSLFNALHIARAALSPTPTEETK